MVKPFAKTDFFAFLGLIFPVVFILIPRSFENIDKFGGNPGTEPLPFLCQYYIALSVRISSDFPWSFEERFGALCRERIPFLKRKNSPAASFRSLTEKGVGNNMIFSFQLLFFCISCTAEPNITRFYPFFRRNRGRVFLFLREYFLMEK